MIIGYIQRILPDYRVPYFSHLSELVSGKLALFAGMPFHNEAIKTPPLEDIRYLSLAKNRYLPPWGKSFFLVNQTNIREWLSQTNPDILICEANPRLLSVARAASWMRKRGRLILAHGFGTTRLSRVPQSLRTLNIKLLLRNFDGIIAYSNYGAQQYQRHGFPADRIFPAINAAVLASEMVNPPPKIPNNKPTVVFLGRLTKGKRPENLLLAIKESKIDANVVFIGDGPYRDDVASLARSIKVSSQFTGHLTGDSLSTQLWKADICVMPGLGGLAIQQAMAHGLPVVAGEGDGTQYDYISPTTGWLLTTNTVSELADVLRDACSDIPRLHRYGQNAFELVKNVLNIESMADKVIEAIQIMSNRYR
jgi:glycosyltransferase involved in cell wall biosynthesis